mmetsp:Transcript_10370/g.40331  ORF Transcript_10370/g.40331 Transcript_10370/m.40331 type:complete len:413 (+) Transcript_10370:713-1951(+)
MCPPLPRMSPARRALHWRAAEARSRTPAPTRTAAPPLDPATPRPAAPPPTSRRLPSAGRRSRGRASESACGRPSAARRRSTWRRPRPGGDSPRRRVPRPRPVRRRRRPRATGPRQQERHPPRLLLRRHGCRCSSAGSATWRPCLQRRRSACARWSAPWPWPSPARRPGAPASASCPGPPRRPLRGTGSRPSRARPFPRRRRGMAPPRRLGVAATAPPLDPRLPPEARPRQPATHRSRRWWEGLRPGPAEQGREEGEGRALAGLRTATWTGALTTAQARRWSASAASWRAPWWSARGPSVASWAGCAGGFAPLRSALGLTWSRRRTPTTLPRTRRQLPRRRRSPAWARCPEPDWTPEARTWGVAGAARCSTGEGRTARLSPGRPGRRAASWAAPTPFEGARAALGAARRFAAG